MMLDNVDDDISFLSSFDSGIFHIRVRQHIAPKTSSLVSIVDLHDSELLHKFVIDLEFLLLELRDYLFSKVNSDDVDQHSQVLELLLSL